MSYRLSESRSSARVLKKKQRLLSPSKNACIVFEICKGRTSEFPYEYQIYYVDCDPNNSGNTRDDELFTHTEPTFRYESRYPLAICGLDSTLYVFEGHDLRTRGETGFAAKVEITPKLLAASPPYYYNRDDEDNKLVPLQSMPYRKYNPAALPTPDGKSILVFSLLLEKKCSDPTFELYDIATDSYQPLPHLAPTFRSPYRGGRDDDDGYACIMAYGFVTKSHFVVNMQDHMETFVLDLSQDIKKWEHLDFTPPTASKHFIGIDSEFFFTTDRVYVAKAAFKLPRSRLPPHEESDWIDYLSCTALLDGHDGNAGAYHTCLVQAEIYPQHCAQYAFTRASDRDKYAARRRGGGKDICLLVVDICSSDINTYKTEVQEHKGGKGPQLSNLAIKTLKFMFDLDIVGCCSMDVFSI